MKGKLNEYDRALVEKSREHDAWEKRALQEGGRLPTPPMLLMEVSKLAQIAVRGELGDGEKFRHSRRSILFYLARHNGVAQQELVSFSHLTPACVSRELSAMEQEELVIRKRDEQDGRAVHVYITEQGRAWNDRVHALLLHRDACMMNGISPEEQELLLHTMIRMRENLIRYMEEHHD